MALGGCLRRSRRNGHIPLGTVTESRLWKLVFTLVIVAARLLPGVAAAVFELDPVRYGAVGPSDIVSLNNDRMTARTIIVAICARDVIVGAVHASGGRATLGAADGDARIINDDAHQFGSLGVIAGDPRIYGRVYLGTQGRGIVLGDIIDLRRLAH